MKRVNIKLVAPLLAATAVLSYCLIGNAGNLEPWAGPTVPTMKTLDEIEPRIAINSNNTPGDAAYEYIVSSPGSYYLPGNFTTTKGGIKVGTDDVTIDLSGYTMTGPVSGSRSGFYLNGVDNVEIRNGTIRSFRNGIFETANPEIGHRVINVRAVSNGLHGIRLGGKNHLVKNCTASDNGHNATSDPYGIYTGSGSTVMGNTVYNNGSLSTASYINGIGTGFGCTVTNNTVHKTGDQAKGLVIYGIKTGDGCTVTGNTSYYNGYKATGYVEGVFADHGSTVTGNTSYKNGLIATGALVYGIYTRGCTVIGNTAYNNGNDATGDVYGFRFAGDSLVDQNLARNNGTGAGSAIQIDYGASGCVFGTNAPTSP